MAIRSKRNNPFYAFKEMHAMLKVFCLLILIVTAIISVLIVLIVYFCSKARDKKQQEILKQAQQEIFKCDTCSNEEFTRVLGDLIRDCLNLKYKFPFKTTDSAEYVFHFCQSIEKLGIKDMRKFFGTDVVLYRVLVTNREITPQARKFCNSAYIMVLDRNVLIDMFTYRIANIKKLQQQ